MDTEREHRTVEYTSPVYRLLGVALAAGALAALGYYFRQVGYADAFGTVAAVALVGSVMHWAHQRPDRLRLRAGPFAKIADAVLESMDDIRAWALERSLRVGFIIYVGYGVGLLALKTLIVFALSSLYAWPLAVAGGCAVAAYVAAPEFFSGLLRGFRLDSEPTNEEDELDRRRRQHSGKCSSEEYPEEDRDAR